MKKYLFLTLVLASTCALSNSGSTHEKQCKIVSEAYAPISKWTTDAIVDKNGLGCPPKALNLSISKLEKLAQRDDACGTEAAASLLAFYGLVSSHPYYSSCGLDTKMMSLMAALPHDEPYCPEGSPNKISDCFVDLASMVRILREKGDLDSSFKLAKRVASSNDPTGLSQINLSTMYFQGLGTTKNLPLSIHWGKEGLERIYAMETRNTLLIQLSVSYKQLGDIESAKKYALICAIDENKLCLTELNWLNYTYPN